MGVIYKITSPSGKVYVGKTYDLRKRINAHKDAAKKKISSIILHNSIRKYGWDAHKLEIIEEVADELLNERESFWIKELKTYCYENPTGLNMTLGGDGQRGAKMSLELRKWFSERFKGEKGSFYGRKHTEEAKKIIAEKASKRNKEQGINVPKWGAEKGRLKVIRAILCYDKYGNLLKEYESLAVAGKELKINHASISESCNEIITGVGGKYVFRYKTPNYPLKIEVGEIKEKTIKRPVLYLSKRLEVIKEYLSSKEASDDLKVPKTTINRAACYNQYKPIRTGHIFIYKDLHEKLSKKVI